MKTQTTVLLLIIFGLASLLACDSSKAQKVNDLEYDTTIVVGAERMDAYLPKLLDKRVAVVANQTSLVNQTHLVDTLLSRGVNLVKVFAPEHGFRGNAAAGETVKSGKDSKTGLSVISLYGSNKKPTDEMLGDVDVLIFDIQDVGARFYTYISTMHYVMEAAAENGKRVIVLDRPNPNGFYVDGPVLDEEFQSFVGMHPIPVVHGLTVGELAEMINGENWLKGEIQCKLEVVTCENYEHRDLYRLPVKPSPNLPTMESIYLYPSLCFFEPTKVSIGRGTDLPFQVVGYPENELGSFSFTPKKIPGVVENPKYENQVCSGSNLKEFGSFYFFTSRELYLDWLVGYYQNYPQKDQFFTSESFFNKLAGNDALKQQIMAGTSVEDIRKSWQEELEKFKLVRKKYLLYPDFE
ncbi:exo-beta-N-acetylmuramidase NamZ family protein [Halocola ammonii]